MAKLFLSHGFKVIATGRNLTERKEIFANERLQYGNKLIELDLDLKDQTQIEEIPAKLNSLGLGLDILINNAGYGLVGPLEEMSDSQIKDQMQVNFIGLALLTKNLLPYLRASRGKIFNISSVFGFIGFPLNSLYCASKFALEGFTESLNYELTSHGVQVCLIQPGAYRTSFGPSLEWAESSVGSSIYRAQVSGYKRFFTQLTSRPNFQDPSDVANGVLDLALRGKVPLRVNFGRDSVFTRYFKALTPRQVFIALSQRVYQKKVFSLPKTEVQNEH